MIEELKSVTYSDIARGKIYWTAIQFTEKRPLGIFKPVDGTNKGEIIEEDDNTFKGRISEETGKLKSEVIDIIIRHKRRMALVIQSDEVNNDFIYVIPITTFDKNDTKIQYYKENKDIPQYHYLGIVTGKEAVANIADIKRIHKSLLLEVTNCEKVRDICMEEIGKKIATIMDIKKLDQCKQCSLNYENYFKDNLVQVNE